MKGSKTGELKMAPSHCAFPLLNIGIKVLGGMLRDSQGERKVIFVNLLRLIVLFFLFCHLASLLQPAFDTVQRRGHLFDLNCYGVKTRTFA